HGLEAHRDGQTARWWTPLSCPRCGGVIAIEHSAPNTGAVFLGSIPQGSEAATGVRHLPPGIEDTNRDAIRALHAGVPSAAAVLLRRTLEGAAAHYDIRERN